MPVWFTKPFTGRIIEFASENVYINERTKLMKDKKENPTSGGACNNSILRACYILDLFTVEDEQWTLKEIADRCHISPTTAIPVLKSLEMCGYLERDANTKRYTLGIKFLEKSQIKINSINIIDKSSGILHNFSRKYRVNTHLGRLDGSDVIYLDRHEAVVHSLSPSYIGKRIPAYCSAMGKVLLAYLDEEDLKIALDNCEMKKFSINTITDPQELRNELESIRRAGFSVDDEEYQTNGYCIGVPIFDVTGKVCAAISCSVTKTPENIKNIPQLKESMIKIGKEISHSVGYES